MVGLTRRLAEHPCLRQIRMSLDSLINRNKHVGSRCVDQPIGQLSLLTWYSSQTENELQTTPVCVDFLRQETKLKDAELIKLVSSVETIGFNSVGQVRLWFAVNLCLNQVLDGFFHVDVSQDFPRRVRLR